MTSWLNRPTGQCLEHRSQEDARRGVGQDGVQVQPAKYALGQLGDYEQQPQGQERLAYVAELVGETNAVGKSGQ